MDSDQASAVRRAGILRYAAIQFVVLTALAMATFAGGTWFDAGTTRYEFTGNFLSDLGTTVSLSGRTNYVSSALFFVALATTGGALVAFAWAWRGFAFARGRVRAAGIASQLVGTASGVAFIGIALTPWNLALRLHNGLVIAAFSLLLIYVVALTIALACNGVTRGRLVANLVYLAIVLAYVAIVLGGPRLGSEDGHRIQVIAQKTVVYASMIHIIFLTTTVRRAARRSV